MSCARVLLHLKAILTFVCLNRLVILCMCGEVKVKVADFVFVCLNRLVILRMCGEVKVKVVDFALFSAVVGGVVCIILCCIWCFSL